MVSSLFPSSAVPDNQRRMLGIPAHHGDGRDLADPKAVHNCFVLHEIRLFCSTLRGDAGGASDIDLLVDYTPGAQVGLFAFIRLRRRLSELLGFPVDLVTPDATAPGHT
jgi:hypothetical protein